ncbi:MAG: dolichyl-phosphate beta-glucosyltransferase [Nanoarchaeota archaeon]
MDLSIVIPVYNEESRIKPFLRDLEDTIRRMPDYEIIFVNDGSKDSTMSILNDFSKKQREVKIISYKKNRGKGYAVRKGVLSSNGKKIIFIDADGSTKPQEIFQMLTLLDSYDVVVGDRTQYESSVDQPVLRQITGKLFNFYANLIFGINVKDNLCGFKGFQREVAKILFRNMISERWIFDVEIFYKIRKNNYSLRQMSIKWNHKEGTKIKPFDPFKMFLQLFFLRIKLMKK